MKQYNHRRMLAEAIQEKSAGSDNIYIIGQSQLVAPAVAAYEFGKWVR